MRYLKVLWHHDEEELPTTLYSEIDEDGYEVRKVELYRDGRFGFADANVSEGGAVLGEVAVPSIEEITAQGPFDAEELSAIEFSAMWEAAQRSARDPAGQHHQAENYVRIRVQRKGRKAKYRYTPTGDLKPVNLDIFPESGKWVVTSPGRRKKPIAEASNSRAAVAAAKALISGIGGVLKLHSKTGIERVFKIHSKLP